MIRRAIILMGLVVWPFAGAWLGKAAAPELAKLNNVVAIAGTTNSGIDQIAKLQARDIRRRFTFGSMLVGAWCGLVVALQIASIQRRGTYADYEVDPMTCVTCGRCWSVCPVERKRMKNARQTP